MVMTCVTGIQQGWDEGDLFKLTISGIARHFRNADETAQAGAAGDAAAADM